MYVISSFTTVYNTFLQVMVPLGMVNREYKQTKTVTEFLPDMVRHVLYSGTSLIPLIQTIRKGFRIRRVSGLEGSQVYVYKKCYV